MKLKKVLLCALAAALLTLPVAAHGHHGGGCGRAVQAAACPVSGCQIARRHAHSGSAGYGQPAASSANARRALCPVEGCEIAGRHVHDSVTYCGYDHAGGFCDGSCRALCPVEGCEIAGRHVHDSVTYCGDGHAAGFCEGCCHA